MPHSTFLLEATVCDGAACSGRRTRARPPLGKAEHSVLGELYQWERERKYGQFPEAMLGWKNQVNVTGQKKSEECPELRRTV